MVDFITILCSLTTIVREGRELKLVEPHHNDLYIYNVKSSSLGGQDGQICNLELIGLYACVASNICCCERYNALLLIN